MIFIDLSTLIMNAIKFNTYVVNNFILSHIKIGRNPGNPQPLWVGGEDAGRFFLLRTFLFERFKKKSGN